MIPANIIYLCLGVVFFVLALVGNLIYTDRELKRKSTINHKKDWLIKAFSLGPCVAMIFLARGDISSLTLKALLSTLLVMAWFWVLFSGIYGLRVANDFFFTGTAIGKDAALSD